MTTWLPSIAVGKEARGRSAGPFTTCPVTWNREPWQGQSRVSPGRSGRFTVQPSCVQMRETAATLVGVSRVTASGSGLRSWPVAATVWPTSGRGTRTRLGPGVGLGVAVPTGVGAAGDPPPPQPATVTAAAAPVVTTNSRRLGKDSSCRPMAVHLLDRPDQEEFTAARPAPGTPRWRAEDGRGSSVVGANPCYDVLLVPNERRQLGCMASDVKERECFCT